MTVSLVTGGLICRNDNVIYSSFNLDADLSLCEFENSYICNGALDVKKANAATLLFRVASDGERISESVLSGALDIIFALKLNQTDSDIDSILIKRLSLSEIEVLPDQGVSSPNLRVNLTSTDLDISAGAYYAGLAVKFDDENIQETQLLYNSCEIKSFNLNQDVIRE